MNLKETVEYKELGYKIVKCPVCGKDTLDSHWICDNCGWEYDNTLDEDAHSVCNNMSINEAKINFIRDVFDKYAHSEDK